MLEINYENINKKKDAILMSIISGETIKIKKWLIARLGMILNRQDRSINIDFFQGAQFLIASCLAPWHDSSDNVLINVTKNPKLKIIVHCPDKKNYFELVETLNKQTMTFVLPETGRSVIGLKTLKTLNHYQSRLKRLSKRE